jgi:hypothetical protein
VPSLLPLASMRPPGPNATELIAAVTASTGVQVRTNVSQVGS